MEYHKIADSPFVEMSESEDVPVSFGLVDKQAHRPGFCLTVGATALHQPVSAPDGPQARRNGMGDLRAA
jgi:hypothetical protein